MKPKSNVGDYNKRLRPKDEPEPTWLAKVKTAIKAATKKKGGQ